MSSHYPLKLQQGWDTTSYAHNAHVSGTERTPGVLTDVSHYPNVHKLFKQVNQEEEHSTQHQHHHKHAQKKVQIIEPTAKLGKNGKGQYIEETIDVKADSFIQQKHKGFELYK